MSRSLRYNNPIICEHLAGQYVVGVMSPRVRARMESLRSSVPELDAAIISWSESFSPIHVSLPETEPQAKTWDHIEEQLFKSSKVEKAKPSIWQSLRFWQFTGISTSIASVAFAVMLFVFPPKPIVISPLVKSTPSYVAVMSPETDKNDIRFVVNVYQKTEKDPSRLFIQWSERQPRASKDNMHLWAKDKDTGKLSYIGVEPSGASTWDLKKATWQAVSNSSELVFTKTNEQPTTQNTLFSGPCIQLGSWKQNLI